MPKPVTMDQVVRAARRRVQGAYEPPKPMRAAKLPKCEGMWVSTERMLRDMILTHLWTEEAQRRASQRAR